MDQLELLLGQMSLSHNPRERLDLLEQARILAPEDDRVRRTALWWGVRYTFLDKKQTRLRDNLIWLLLCADHAARGGRRADVDFAATAWRQVMQSPALHSALEADPEGLYPQLLDAAQLYAETLREQRSALGFLMPRQSDPAVRNKRVAAKIIYDTALPLAVACRDLPHLPLYLRALWEGTCLVYPDIWPALHGALDGLADDEARAFLSRCMQPGGGQNA